MVIEARNVDGALAGVYPRRCSSEISMVETIFKATCGIFARFARLISIYSSKKCDTMIVSLVTRRENGIRRLEAFEKRNEKLKLWRLIGGND